VVGFGEVVLFKLPVKGPRSQPDGNMGTTQGEGVFMGYTRNANTFIIMTDDGKVEARSLVRRPEANRWSADRLASIKATPWSLREKAEAEVRFEQPAEEAAAPPAAAAPAAPKEFRINQSDVLEHGYSGGCGQCTHIERYGRGRPGGRHTALCRKRMIEAISQTDVGKKRIADYELRLGRAMVEFSNPDQVEAAPVHEAPRAVRGEIIGSKRRVLGEADNADEFSSVPFRIPGTEPATRVPTSGRRDGNVVEKSPGPSGLRGGRIRTLLLPSGSVQTDREAATTLPCTKRPCPRTTTRM
jgi:hypothetical protein